MLYRTRGHDWDYAFLLQPERLLGEGWYTLHRRIFANVEPNETPVFLRGELGIGTGRPFFATAFTDPARRDYQARPIAHYVTWFGKAAEEAPGWSFGPGLVGALAPRSTRCSACPRRALAGRNQGRSIRCSVRAFWPRCRPECTCQLHALRWLATCARCAGFGTLAP